MGVPQGFLELIASYSSPVLEGVGDALLLPPEVSVRANRGKGYEVRRGLERVLWNSSGAYLDEKVKFAFDPMWHQGAYYVQDASSMFVGEVVRQLSGGKSVRLLDACAAPGGKTTAAMDALPEGSTVVANEFVPSRLEVLKENVAKWGFPRVKVTGGDTSRFRNFEGEFDIVLADVPCSGEGMMRKEEVAVEQWSERLIDECAARQREIVSNLWPAVKPGGFLVYSTCTFNRRENEEMVEHIINEYGGESVELEVDEKWGIGKGIDTEAHCYRFVPGKTRGEGLFVSVIRKPLTAEVSGLRKERKSKELKDNRKGGKGKENVTAEVKEWIADNEGEWRVEEGCAVVRFGKGELAPELCVACMKGRDWIPTQELAMSRLLARGNWPEYDVSASEAIDFLGCKALLLPGSVAKGIVLLTFKGEPLGWVKNVGNRANNLYPKAWRILSASPEPVKESPVEKK